MLSKCIGAGFMKKLLSFLLAVFLVLSAAPARAESLGTGDTGDQVAALQTRMLQLQYYTGSVNGLYDAATSAAVAAVQAAYRLPATGMADTTTLSVIYGDCYRPLAYGSSGEDVKRLQRRLTELGYYHGLISGNYLDGSTAAIGHFQYDSGLYKTGKADVVTQAMLYSGVLLPSTPAPSAGAPAPSPLATTSPSVMSILITETPAPSASPSPSGTPPYPGKLEYGSKGNGVKLLQERLKELGFFSSKITSGYYEETLKAVKAFQKKNGLRQDGVIGLVSWNAMWAGDVANAQSSPKPTAVPTPVPYYIEVDVRNQVVTVYGRSASGAYDVPVRKLLCSTGTAQYPSDLGLFTLNGHIARWATFPAWGGGWAQYWVRINASIAFHSVLYNTVDTMDLITGSFSNLGRRASHGCIRLTVEGAKWIYDNCGKGTQVRIRADLTYDPEMAYTLKPGSLNKANMLPNATARPTPYPAYNGAVVPSGEMRTLKVGSAGADVYWLQQKLRELGFYTGTVTGQYREGTANAVKAYQRANGLFADGISGSKTLTRLYKQVEDAYAVITSPLPTLVPSAPGTPSPSPAPTPSPTPNFTVESD
jgi:peptidoglycan hydrolase-like protein with peptidoglycan-binding domain